MYRVLFGLIVGLATPGVAASAAATSVPEPPVPSKSTAPSPAPVTASTIAGASAQTVPSPAEFTSGGSLCTANGQIGVLHVPDFDDAEHVVDVPFLCVTTDMFLPVNAPLPDDTRLALLECADELASLSPGSACEDAENRLKLEGDDPAAFATRRQLEAVALQLAVTQASVLTEGSMNDLESQHEADLTLAMIDMLNAYASIA